MKGNNMRGQQRGMTLIGFIIGLMVFCVFAYMAMVLGPAYNEYFAVKKAMNFVAQESSGNEQDLNKLAKALDRQFNVGYVENVTGSQATLIKNSAANILVMDYEVRKAFVYNIDFVIKFKYQVPLGGGPGKGTM
jgi:Tfp pilus assembly major pilin PilA